VEVVGVHQHIGSQITEVQPFVTPLRNSSDSSGAQVRGIDIQYVNIGAVWASRTRMKRSPAEGRGAGDPAPAQGQRVHHRDGARTAIVGNAGILVTRALYHKKSGEKRFLIVDAA